MTLQLEIIGEGYEKKLSHFDKLNVTVFLSAIFYYDKLYYDKLYFDKLSMTVFLAPLIKGLLVLFNPDPYQNHQLFSRF